MGSLSDLLYAQTGDTVGQGPFSAARQSPLAGALSDPEVRVNPFLGIDDSPPAVTPGPITPANPARELTYAGMGMSILGGLLKGMSAVQAGEYNAQTAEGRARVALMAAGDARARGQVAAQVLLLRGSQLASKQKASYAGAGVAVNSGSAVEAEADTKGMSAFDALMAENNAAREAWGYGEQARQFGQQAAIDRALGRNVLGESILGGVRGAATYALNRQIQIT